LCKDNDDIKKRERKLREIPRERERARARETRANKDQF
jgi:hypothetical protein